MFTPETQCSIKDVARWMDTTMVPLGTMDGHARMAVRGILGLARLTGCDMARVEAKITECLAVAGRVTGRVQEDEPGMTPMFTREEVPGAARVA
jgi:hypothetical protein